MRVQDFNAFVGMHLSIRDRGQRLAPEPRRRRLRFFVHTCTYEPTSTVLAFAFAFALAQSTRALSVRVITVLALLGTDSSLYLRLTCRSYRRVVVRQDQRGMDEVTRSKMQDGMILDGEMIRVAYTEKEAMRGQEQGQEQGQDWKQRWDRIHGYNGTRVLRWIVSSMFVC